MTWPTLDVLWSTTGTPATVLSGVREVEWTRGRSSDYNSDAQGAATILLNNEDDTYTLWDWRLRQPILIRSTKDGVQKAQFFGNIKNISRNAKARTVTITCYDILKVMADRGIIVPSNSFALHTGRTMRRAVLEDFERGSRNLVGHNPALTTNTVGWGHTGSSFARATSGGGPDGATAYGSFVAGAGGQRAYIYGRFAPIFFDGETYRWAPYLRVPSGTSNWKIGLGLNAPGAGSDLAEKVVALDTTWRRHTLTYRMPRDAKASIEPLGGWVESLASGTVRIGNVMLTRGKELHPYSELGTGRWPNWVGNGDFEGGYGILGWTTPFYNLIGNGSFESNVDGWTGGITRAVGDAAFGSARADITDVGAVWDFGSLQFDASAIYDFGATMRVTSGIDAAGLILGSEGTPADQEMLSGNVGTSYAGVVGSWQPTANRTDVRLLIDPGFDRRADGVFVYKRTAGGQFIEFVDTGPGAGAGRSPTAQIIVAGASRYGYQAQYVSTPAVAGAGIMYDYVHYGSFFAAGQQYTIQFSVYPVGGGSLPYKAGVAFRKTDGTYDDQSTTGTFTGNQWNDETLTFTPTVDWDAATLLKNLFYFWQTDATARVFYIDAVRAEPGAVADEFERPYWFLYSNVAAVHDLYSPEAKLEASASSALGTLNKLQLARHWIRPKLVDPFYDYIVSPREFMATKSVVETFDNTFSGFEDTDEDLDSVINVIGISYGGDKIEHYSDEASVDEETGYGPRPGGDINGALFFTDRTIPDKIGPSLITLYKDPHGRPTMKRRAKSEESATSILTRELDDLIEVNVDPLAQVDKKYLIVRLKVKVSFSMNVWDATYGLEEYLF